MNLKDKTVVIDNNTYRCSKIVILETSERSNLRLSSLNKLSLELHIQGKHYNGVSHLFQHLYILSDDKIEEDDWVYDEEAKYVRQLIHKHNETDFDVKIIASTDKSLNLPKPSDSFLQVYIDAYNKGEKIEECLVEYEKYWANSKGAKGNTFTEVALFEESINDYDAILVYYPKITKGEITIRKVKDSWSREEVEQLCRKAYREGAAYSIGSHDNFKQIHLTENEWISENL